MKVVVFILAILAFIYIQNRFYRSFTYKALEITGHFDRRTAFPGEIVTYEITLVNRKLLPVTGLRVQQKMPASLRPPGRGIKEDNRERYDFEVSLSILPFQKVVRRYSLLCMTRGYHELADDAVLTATDLFGTEEFVKSCYLPAGILVLPKLRNIRELLLPVTTLQGELFVQRWILEDPMAVSGIRDYSGTDSLKTVNWKATARIGRLEVNTYEYTADRKIMLLYYLGMDKYLSTDREEADMEKTVEAAASFIVAAAKQGIPVGFGTNALCLPLRKQPLLSPACGEKHTAQMLELLAGMKCFCKYKFEEIMHYAAACSDSGTELVIFASEPGTDLEDCLLAYKAWKTTVILTKPVEPGEMPGHVNVLAYGSEDELFEE